VEELQNSFGNSSEREMTLVRQVRELKLEREEHIKRDNAKNAKIEKLQDSESILRKQIEHSLAHVSSLRKQVKDSEAKVHKILDEKINGSVSVNSDIELATNGNITLLTRKNQSLSGEIFKLKYQIKSLKSRNRSIADEDISKNSKDFKEDSLSRATNIIVNGSGQIFNFW